jgi:hypothetical protein
MRTKIKCLMILVLASLVFAGCCTMHSKTAQWEYKTVKFPFEVSSNMSKSEFQDYEDQLNQLGKEGWKLVTVNVQTSSGTSLESYYVFERPRH